VDMSKAVREYGSGSGALTRLPDTPGVFSAWGVIGDATVGTKAKGQGFVEAVVAGALEDIDGIRKAPLPVEKTTPTLVPRPAAAARPQSRSDPQQPNGCMPTDERAIRAVGERFTYWWRQMDAARIAELFTPEGDMRHPDGTIERGRSVISENRHELFAKPEYRGSSHPITLGDIRCLPGGNVAIADGKWELRLEAPATSGAPARNLGSGLRHSGLCTLVLVGGGGAWSIQAWRYTVDPENGTPPPTTLKQPGFIGRGGG